MDRLIDTFANELIDSGLATKRDVVGCSSAEIEELERYFDLELPASYKDFLEKMGKGAGLFLQGTDVFYHRLFEIREAMEEVLGLDGNPFSLTKKTFVFSSHQGYIFHFFDTSQHLDDPRVYGYREGELQIKLLGESFIGFLKSCIQEQIASWGKGTKRVFW